MSLGCKKSPLRNKQCKLVAAFPAFSWTSDHSECCWLGSGSPLPKGGRPEMSPNTAKQEEERWLFSRAVCDIYAHMSKVTQTTCSE